MKITNPSETETVTIAEYIEKITELEPKASMDLDPNTKKWTDGKIVVEIS